MLRRLLGALFAVLLIAQPAFAQVMKLHPAAASAAPGSCTAANAVYAANPFYFTADDPGVVHGGGLVSVVPNGGTAGGSAVQASGGAQPTYNATGLNSLPTITGNGTSQFLATGNLNFPSATTITMFMVISRSTTGNYDAVFTMNKSAATGFGAYFAGGTQQNWVTDSFFAFDNGFVIGTSPQLVFDGTASATLADTNFHIVQVDIGAANVGKIGGTTVGNLFSATGPPSAETSQIFYIGSDNGGGGNWYHGSWAMLFVGVNLTSQNKTDVHSCLASKYGLP